MMMIISLFLEKTPPYYAPSPSPPKVELLSKPPLASTSLIYLATSFANNTLLKIHTIHPTLQSSPLDIAQDQN